MSRGHTPFANSVHSTSSAAQMLNNPSFGAHDASKSQAPPGIKSSKGSNDLQRVRIGKFSHGPAGHNESSLGGHSELTKKLINDFERKRIKQHVLQPSYKSRIDDGQSMQYKKLTIIDDFGVDLKDMVPLNVASASINDPISEPETPQQ